MLIRTQRIKIIKRVYCAHFVSFPKATFIPNPGSQSVFVLAMPDSVHLYSHEILTRKDRILANSLAAHQETTNVERGIVAL